jgi:3,4-dihydroxy-2-butanone 4-phosphate synthase
MTVRTLLDPISTPDDLLIPGHIFPYGRGRVC